MAPFFGDAWHGLLEGAWAENGLRQRDYIPQWSPFKLARLDASKNFSECDPWSDGPVLVPSGPIAG